MSLIDRVQGAVLHGALRLPAVAQRRLAGDPIRKDGVDLALDLQLMLRLQRVSGEPDAATLSLAQARGALDKQARLAGGSWPIGEVQSRTVDGADGPLPARLYVPQVAQGDQGSADPLLVFFHGGGFFLGSLDSHDAPCRFLAEQAKVRVLSVDYRLAPEHKDPALTRDCAAAYRWAVAHAAELGADPARIGVGGDSAGGYLAAVTALTAAADDLPCAFQLLLYPMGDARGGTPSRDLFAEGFFLTRAFIDRANEAWLEPGRELADPAISLVLRDPLPAGLAPAYVATAGFDPLRDEGETYAAVLDKAGVVVEHRRFGDQIHGFINPIGAVRTSREATSEIARALSRGLA